MGYDMSILSRMSPSLRAQAEKQIKQQQKAEISSALSAQCAHPPAPVRTAKYGNKPTERILPNGEVIKFGSKKEAARYDFLSLELRQRRIRKLRLQYQFLLKPAYTDGETGERFRAVSYLADFYYERFEDGAWKIHVEDTKGHSGSHNGTKTKDFNIKRKLLADQGVIIEII